MTPIDKPGDTNSPPPLIGKDCSSPWKYYDNGSCKCGDIPHEIIHCDDSSHKNVSVLNSYCMTYDEQANITEVGTCIYHNDQTSTNYSLFYIVPDRSEVSNFTCRTELQRSGTLCGRCNENHYPLAYSFDMNCIPCPNGASNWWKYMLMAFLPLTLFSSAILFFKINITSSNLLGFVFYSQAVSTPQLLRTFILIVKDRPLALKALRCIGVLYGFWNLDFFRLVYPEVCLGLNSLQTIVLDLVVGVYPLFLMALTYLTISLYDKNFWPLKVVCRPFRAALRVIGENWVIKTSLIDSFATFLLLSNVKILSVAYDLLAPVYVYQLNSAGVTSRAIRLFYDPSLSYFGPEHKPYAIVGALMLLLFVLLPTLLMIVYPIRWFQKFLNLFPGRWYILHTFMDSFQGCYKDGTEPGTRDCRWFASVFFVLRSAAIMVAIVTKNTSFFPLSCVLFVMVAVVLTSVQPFKENVDYLTNITTMFLLLLALWYVAMAGIGISFTKRKEFVIPLLLFAFAIGTLPLVYISVLIFHWVCSHKKFGIQIFRSIAASKRGYDRL
jgi:hypothetical protein